MTRLNRTIHLDFHTMPDIPDMGEGFDAEVFAQTLADAHVQSVNMLATCAEGFAYYPTKVGIMHPHLKFDMIGSMLEACHKKGIKFVAYVNWTFMHEIARKHPEWCRMDENGAVRIGPVSNGNPLRTMCYNSDGYKEYLKGIVKEICEYDIDGIYFDCIYPRPCWCNKCTEDMLAAGLDINSTADVTEFTYNNILKLMKEIREIVPKHLNIVYSAVAAEHKQGLQYRVELEHLPTCWGYEQVPYHAANNRTWYGEENIVYMTGRFQKCWGDHGGFKGKVSLQNDMYDALWNGMGFCVGDHMHPGKNLDKGMYKIFGEVFEEFMQYEKWTDDAKYVADIAVVKNLYTAHHDNIAVRYTDEMNAGTAAGRILNQLNYNYNVVTEMNDFSKYKVVILPDLITMTDGLKAKLEEYIAGGGKVISTGESGLNQEHTAFALDAWDFIEFEKVDTTETAFYKTEHTQDELDDFAWSTYHSGLFMKAKDKKHEIAAHVNPYFDRVWNGLHGYYYVPPAKESGYSVMAMNDNVCQISFKLFSAYGKFFAPFHQNLIKCALERFLPDPVIKSDNMPSTSRLSVTATEDYALLHVKTTFPEHRGNIGIIEEHIELPAGHSVSVKGEYKSAVLLPAETPVEFKVENGYTTVILPQINGYAMFKLDK